jgi:hypothetical protein
MPEQLDDQQVGVMLRSLWEERAPFLARLRTRRLLLQLASETVHDETTGTWLPPEWKDSHLVIRVLGGDPFDVLRNYVSRIAANEPMVAVEPIGQRGTVGKRVDEHAGEQERMLGAMWQALGGRQAQFQVTWSQAWGRCGWYLTLPRDAAWGLPDRQYYDDLLEDEIEELQRTGKITADADGRYMESAESWLERRKHSAQERAFQPGASLATLRAYPPDMVLPRYEDDGTARKAIKYAFTVEEIPGSDLKAGAEYARAAAKRAGIDGPDIDRYGLWLDQEGKIQGGVTLGGEPDSQRHRDRYTLAKLITPTEVYYYVTETPGGGGGRIIWHDEHNAGRTPLIPVPGMYTDSMAPGAEFSSMMESVFAAMPLLNQLETLVSNVATWNGLGRYYIVMPDGSPVQDADGNRLYLTTTDVVGNDPGSMFIAEGEIKQLTNDSLSSLLPVLQLYLERLDRGKPAPVTEGQSGADAAAWQVRLLLEASSDELRQAVNNHAEAVRDVMLCWIRWGRMLDEPLYAFAAPGNRRDERSVRGLVEIDPANLVESIRVHQSSQGSQQRIALQAAGAEQLQLGLIDRFQYYDEYALEQDPLAAVKRADVQQASDLVLWGNTDNVQPGSVVGDLVEAVRGRAHFTLLRESPNYALATAQGMAERAAAAVAAPQAPPMDGNLAEATGVREPGLGMGQQQPGSPQSQQPQLA